MPRSSLTLDPQRPIQERVADCLREMTLEEKLAQMGGVWATALLEGDRFSETRAKESLGVGIGHVTRLGGSGVLRPSESAALANEIQRFLVENTRLGIPAILHEESCAGYTASDATCFPQAIGLASTWAPELIEEMAGVIRRQMRAVGAHQALAPVLDLARDPRWGRTEETYGEDPYLTARLGVAYVRGLQGEDLSSGVVATAKHFVGYGASDGGRNWAPARIPRRELLERFVSPFEAAIREAGLASVMNAYHEIDGVPCGASKELLDELLRGELGFNGVVVSDYFTVPTLMTYHRIADREEEAARRALDAGIDVELPALQFYGEPLREAVDSGRIPQGWVDRAVERILGMKFRLGLFENPYVDAGAASARFDTTDDRELARRIAQKSIVLLKNQGDLLPLEKSLGKLALIGPSADSARLLQGDYHFPTHLEMMFGRIEEGPNPARPGAAELPAPGLAPAPGVGDVDLAKHFVRMVTILEGIRSKVDESTEILRATGCEIEGDSTAGVRDAAEAARAADVAIVVVGGRSGLIEGCTSGESNDRADLSLPGAQETLVKAVAETGTPTVVLLVNGRPLAIPWIAEHVPAVLEVWLPGEEGGNAVADILFGDVAPSGKLPISLPRSSAQLPVHYDQKPSGGRSQWRGNYVDLSTRPLFPFGHGLGYTDFEYQNLVLDSSEIAPTDVLRMRLDVTNTGSRAGEEVVQCYARDRVASVTRPIRQLVGFKRVALEPGETRTIHFHLDLGQLAFHDIDMMLVVEPGEVEILMGSSSEDIRAKASFEITGERRVLSRSEIVPTLAEIR